MKNLMTTINASCAFQINYTRFMEVFNVEIEDNNNVLKLTQQSALFDGHG